MFFLPDDILKLKNFCQQITDKPRPLNAQWNVRKDGFIWCADWKIIELLKYFFNGREMYIGDPPPNRLKKNPLWNKEAIMEEAELIKTFCSDTDAIIEYLKKLREEPQDGAPGIAGN